MFALIERLISFVIAIYAIKSGLMFLSRLMSGFRHQSTVAQSPRPAAQQPKATLLHQDPVCGTYVSIETSLKRICHGKVIHFCSEECRDRYRA